MIYFISGIAPGGDAYDPENSGLPVPPPDMGGLPLDGGAPFVNQRGGGRGGRGSRGRGRGGFAASGGRSHQNRRNSTIVVENIPKEHCVIDKVNEYFKQFGTITNISLETELSKAVVQYSSHQEADAAYSSPEVIFNNRFVKVYWQKAEAKDQEAAVTPPPKPAAPKTYEPSPEVVAAKAAEFAKLKEIKQKQQQARLQTMLELQKSKEQLIQKQIQEQKELMEKLANAKTPEERSSIMSALNNITNPTSSAPAATTAPVTAETDKASDEQTQTEDEKKEETAEDLKAKLARLEAEVRERSMTMTVLLETLLTPFLSLSLFIGCCSWYPWSVRKRPWTRSRWLLCCSWARKLATTSTWRNPKVISIG